MNACLRAVVRAGLSHSMDVVGIRRGFQGIFDQEFVALDRPSVVNIVQRGGTILGTSRSPRMRTEEGLREAVELLRRNRIDAMVLIGGDGTFRGGAALEAAGGPRTVGVPGTIDNDVVGSDLTLGFDTAVNTALDAIDRIRDTATSHELLHFVEVMGRRCGAIALAAGLAGGAEVVLVSERPLSDEELATRIGAAIARGKRSVIVVASEGARPHGTDAVARHVGSSLGLDYRLTVLGHVQRGGAPSAADRILGAHMGVEAVAAIAAGGSGVFIGQRNGQLVHVPYESMTTEQAAPVGARLVEIPDVLA
jgi:6-phosphofructokinase 1